MAIAESIIGTHYRYPDYFEVGREQVRGFAKAVKDDHPAHYDEDAAKEIGYDSLVASLTFLAVAGRKVQLEIFKQFAIPINMERVLHRDQKITFHRPILAGDKLLFDSYLDSVIEAHGTVVTEIRGEASDADGKPVITSVVTVIGEAANDDEAGRSECDDQRTARRRHRQNDCRAKLQELKLLRRGARRPVRRNVSRGTYSCGWPATDTASAGWFRGPGQSVRT